MYLHNYVHAYVHACIKLIHILRMCWACVDHPGIIFSIKGLESIRHYTYQHSISISEKFLAYHKFSVKRIYPVRIISIFGKPTKATKYNQFNEHLG